MNAEESKLTSLQIDSHQEHNPTPEEQPTPKKKKVKTWVKWLIGIILTPLVLLLLVGLLLYFPPVQRLAINIASDKISQATGWEVSVGRIRLYFPLRLKVDGVLALDAKKDTVAYVRQAKADVPLMPLFGGVIPMALTSLEGTVVNYNSKDSLFSIIGRINEVRVNNAMLNLDAAKLHLNNLNLYDAELFVFYGDTTKKEKPDTVQKSKPWRFYLGDVDLQRVHARFAMHRDSDMVNVNILSGEINNGEVNLVEQYYKAGKLALKGEVKTVGAYIDFIPYPWEFNLAGSKLHYDSVNVAGNIKDLYFVSGDGWTVQQASLCFDKNSKRAKVTDLDLLLQTSRISGSAELPMKGWIPDTVGYALVDLNGIVFPKEIERFLPKSLKIPDNPIMLDLTGEGQIEDKLALRGTIKAEDMADLKLDGTAISVMDSLNRSAKVDLELLTGNVMRYAHYFGIKNPSWCVPAGMRLKGWVDYNPRMLKFDANINPPDGRITASGFYGMKSEAFKADVKVQSVDLRQFLTADSIGVFSGLVTAEGRGTDIFSRHTQAHIYAVVDSINFKNNQIREVTLLSELKNNQFFAALNSDNEAINLTAQVDATLKKNDVAASINVFVDTIIPSQIGLASGPVHGASLELRSNLRSDLKQYYDFQGEIENAKIETDRAFVRPNNIYISALTSADSLAARVSSGDLKLVALAQNGLNDFTKRIQDLTKEIKQFTADTTGVTDMRPWIKLYPEMQVNLSMGRSNALRTYFDEMRIGFRRLNFDLETSSQTGLSGQGYIHYFQKDTFRIDEMDLVLRQDSAFFYAIASAHKERFRSQDPFNAMVSLTTNVHRSEVFLNWKDKDEKDFLQLGLELYKMNNNDFTLKFTPDPPVLAYNRFTVHGGNYVTFPANDRGRPKADMLLRSDDNAEIAVKDQEHADQYILNLNIKDFSLDKIRDLSFIPDINGVVNATAEWSKLPENKNLISGAVKVDNFHFDKKKVGDLMATATMRDVETGSRIQGLVRLDKHDAITAEAFMPKAKDAGMLWHLMVNQLPLEKANPFLPKEYAEMKGTMEANLSNFNTSANIETARAGSINGQINLYESSVFVPRLNQRYRLDSKPIIIDNDVVRLNQYAITTDGAHLTTDGSVVIKDRIPVDLHIYGNDMTLLDSDRTQQTMVYGKVVANADIRLNGPAQAMNVNGRLALLGSTNVTYVNLKEEIQDRDRFKGLVEFEDFTDTLFVVKKNAIDSLSLGGMNIHLGLYIDPAVQVNAILTRDENNRAHIQGGGDLAFAMPPYGNMSLNGTYEINDGYINYSFPPIPARRFIVQRNSRVTWTGEVMNPNIDFKATSRIQSNVALAGEEARKVDFDVSIVAKNDVQDISLMFTVEAPSDATMRNNLAIMTDEEKNRQSVYMLATGQYLGSQSSGAGFDVNSALSSLLTSQITSLAGDALNAEINLGIEENAVERGGGMNYSYSIAKKFYNDRINVVVGGKVETNAIAMGYNQSFINDMSIDYRIDRAGTHYLRLFHKRNYENILDGEVIETGAGYVIRRRLDRLKDLFNFRKRSNPIVITSPMPEMPDSIPDSTTLTNKRVKDALPQKNNEAIPTNEKKNEDE